MKKIKWGKFRIGDLFDVENTWEYGKNKYYINRHNNKCDGSVEVISGVTVNNGVNYYTTDLLNDSEIYQDMLTISTRGEYSGTVTYHGDKFVLANNILTMPMPGWSRNSKLFIATVIGKIGYGGYSGYPRKETLIEDIIYLPINASDKIDFDFMDSYISELEAYLTITGLKDYKLSKKEELTVKKLLNDEIKYKKYKIIDLFDVNNSSNILSSDITFNSGETPYLGATSQNNGVLSYITYDENLKEKGDCVFIGGKTFVVTYQEKDFYSNDSHNLSLYFKNKKEINKFSQLFFCTSIYKALYNKYFWNNSISKTKIHEDFIMLPINDEDKIDYEFMITIISAIQKLVIEDVILYSENKINITKKVIKNATSKNKVKKNN